MIISKRNRNMTGKNDESTHIYHINRIIIGIGFQKAYGQCNMACAILFILHWAQISESGVLNISEMIFFCQFTSVINELKTLNNVATFRCLNELKGLFKWELECPLNWSQTASCVNNINIVASTTCFLYVCIRTHMIHFLSLVYTHCLSGIFYTIF